MIGEKMQAAINEQIREEFGSAYLYLAMAAWFESRGFRGMAHWMRVQAIEESDHAMRFFRHLTDRAGQVRLQALAEPQAEWDSPLAAFRAAFRHEQYITQRIDALTSLALEVKDHAAHIMLQWFITEQIEEEANASQIVEELERIGEAGHGLLMIDRELGQRPMAAALTALAAGGQA